MLYAFNGYKPEVSGDSYVSETAIVIGNVKIAEKCYIGHGVILRGDYGSIEIGSETAIEEGVIVHSTPGDTSRIGSRVTIGHGAIVHSLSIDDSSVIGMGSILSMRARIGRNSIVAEGALVKKDQVISDNVIVGGSPARIIREMTQKDIDFWAKGKQVYVDLAAEYLKKGMQSITDPL